ncbi:MAG: phosphoribosylformylglycinamidine cyclo-ligase [Bacteroidia bacterium]|nr:phosphoribosylformylglycinamidine cyclo-ligase [Bacteroidia bacterium]
MREQEDWYRSLGVSAHKSFLERLPGHSSEYFVSLNADIAGDPGYRFALHADGVGTKGILSYLWWRESGRLSLWRALAQDALVMNTDDMACAGITDGFVFSTTITRNPFHIPDEVVQEIIAGVYGFVERLQEWGFSAQVAGGETADMPDVVRTVGLEAVAAARISVEKLLPIRRPTQEVCIVGLASAGQAIYEEEYNSGIGCNGLTAVRHLLLSAQYASRFPETLSPEQSIAYQGRYALTDLVEGYPLGELLISPTRTYLPILREMYRRYAADIYAVIHCTGGGQRKALKYLPYMVIRKENFFPLPPLFSLLEGTRSWQELFEALNMGHRIELYVSPGVVDELIALAHEFRVEAQVIGTARPSERPTRIEASFRGESWVWKREG